MPEGSLNIKRSRGYYYFYHYIDSRQVPIRNNMAFVYRLARKKYLSYIIRNCSRNAVSKLLDSFVAAGLSLPRITLTPRQYRWTTSSYPKNSGWKENLKYCTPAGVAVRSKSERDIGSRLEYYAVPYRYDMLFKINVSVIVKGLREHLAGNKHWHYEPHKLFTYQNGHCVWNVPAELQWMNSPGSIWRSYDSISDTITISVDFTIMLRDGSLLLWEHAGLCLNPIYRCNTSERIFVIRAASFAPIENTVFTTENDILDLADIDRIICDVILPRL